MWNDFLRVVRRRPPAPAASAETVTLRRDSAIAIIATPPLTVGPVLGRPPMPPWSAGERVRPGPGEQVGRLIANPGPEQLRPRFDDRSASTPVHAPRLASDATATRPRPPLTQVSEPYLGAPYAAESYQPAEPGSYQPAEPGSYQPAEPGAYQPAEDPAGWPGAAEAGPAGFVEPTNPSDLSAWISQQSYLEQPFLAPPSGTPAMAPEAGFVEPATPQPVAEPQADNQDWYPEFKQRYLEMKARGELKQPSLPAPQAPVERERTVQASLTRRTLAGSRRLGLGAPLGEDTANPADDDRPGPEPLTVQPQAPAGPRTPAAGPDEDGPAPAEQVGGVSVGPESYFSNAVRQAAPNTRPAADAEPAAVAEVAAAAGPAVEVAAVVDPAPADAATSASGSEPAGVAGAQPAEPTAPPSARPAAPPGESAPVPPTWLAGRSVDRMTRPDPVVDESGPVSNVADSIVSDLASGPDTARLPSPTSAPVLSTDRDADQVAPGGQPRWSEPILAGRGTVPAGDSPDSRLDELAGSAHDSPEPARYPTGLPDDHHDDATSATGQLPGEVSRTQAGGIGTPASMNEPPAGPPPPKGTAPSPARAVDPHTQPAQPDSVAGNQQLSGPRPQSNPTGPAPARKGDPTRPAVTSASAAPLAPSAGERGRTPGPAVSPAHPTVRYSQQNTSETTQTPAGQHEIPSYRGIERHWDAPTSGTTATLHRLPSQVAAGLSTVLSADVTATRIVRGPWVNDTARSMKARAFTQQGTVFLPDDAGPLDSGLARSLLAHELTHLLQAQEHDHVPESNVQPDDLEQQALAAESAILGTGPAPVFSWRHPGLAEDGTPFGQLPAAEPARTRRAATDLSAPPAPPTAMPESDPDGSGWVRAVAEEAAATGFPVVAEQPVEVTDPEATGYQTLLAELTDRVDELDLALRDKLTLAGDLDEAALARRLFTHLHGRLRTEFVLERERTGRLGRF